MPEHIRDWFETRAAGGFIGAFCAVAVLISSGCARNVSRQDFPFRYTLPRTTIVSDSGGQVIRYALRAHELREQGRQVRFTGNCRSACTLYLSLPRDQTCMSPNAYFGFHRPWGVSTRDARFIDRYMLHLYPEWVKRWIRSNGGLGPKLKLMRYDYAGRHLRTCNTFGGTLFVRSERVGPV